MLPVQRPRRLQSKQPDRGEGRFTGSPCACQRPVWQSQRHHVNSRLSAPSAGPEIPARST